LSTKSTKGTKKTSAVGFSLTASYPAFIHRLPRQAPYIIHPGQWDAVVLAGTDIICIPHIPVGYAGTHREVKLRVTQVFTGCVVIPIVPGLALGKKQADRQTFQVF